VQLLVQKRRRIVAFRNAILLDPKGKGVAWTSQSTPLRGPDLAVTLERLLGR
jgi:hypothetical protein